jgi:urease accessory protein
VGSAAGPLAGDDLCLDLEVGPGAHLTVRSVAAAVVLPGASRWAVTARVAPGAVLALCPEPTVVTSGADRGRRLLREELVLGRYGECGGRVTARTSVSYAGAPLFRHDVVLDGADPLTASPAVLGAARAYGAVLRCGDPPGPPRTGPGWAALPLEGPGELVTAVAATAAALRRRLLAGSAERARTPD